MKISTEVLVNVNAVKYSHCGRFLGFGFSNELTVIRTHDELTVFNVYCSGKIKTLEWSIDSDHILCVIENKNSVQVFSISSPEWTCVIQEGPAGLLNAFWSPTATHIVTVAEFAVRLSIWSLMGRSVAFIEAPFIKPKDKLSFSPDGKLLAVTMGKLGDFKLLIISTFSWTITTEILCTGEINVPSVPLWSSDGLYIVIWETVDYERSLLEIYSVKTGKKLGHFNIFQRNKLGGICSVVWTQYSQFLLIGCRDDCIYILNYITWNVTTVFRHEKVIENEKCQILREIANADESRFLTVCDRPTKFTFIVPSARHNKMPGIKSICISSDGIHVVSQCQLLPAVLWIWNLNTLSLTNIIAFRNAVTDLIWSSSCLNLLICDGSSKVTLWHPNKISHLSLISRGIGRKIKKARWRPNATDNDKTMLLFSSVSILTVSNFE